MSQSSQRRIVTGEDVRSLPEGSLLDVAADTMFTDIAREWIARRKIRLVEKAATSTDLVRVRIALGADHAGFEAKEMVKEYLREVGASFHDYGTHSKDPVDYPDFAHAVALAVALGHAPQGIVVDGAGIGSAIVANKVPGIRAAACNEPGSAQNAREHNDINVLTLGARLIALENLRKIVSIFLAAEHTEPRHRARVAKITAVEKKYRRSVGS